jgi:hypothetical protein
MSVIVRQHYIFPSYPIVFTQISLRWTMPTLPGWQAAQTPRRLLDVRVDRGVEPRIHYVVIHPPNNLGQCLASCVFSIGELHPPERSKL